MVIDLDKCISIQNNKLICSNEVKIVLNLFSDAYCEISPSNTGLYIIFQGKWLINSNKVKQYIYESLKKGTVEVYSGSDCRYITLTSKSIKKNMIDLIIYFTVNLYKHFFIDSLF